MNKANKLANLEAARILLITANDLIKIALDKVYLTGPSGIDSGGIQDAVAGATCVVVYLQNKLEKK